MLNWYLRYEPFIRVLDERGVRDVLDVGSGWYGLSWYWPHRVVQTDLNFAEERPSAPRPGQAEFLYSTAERLPFPDDAFDYVLSSDMLEHLPDDIRGPSVAELTRVARRGILIGFPSGHSALLDRLTARLLRLMGKVLPSWLEEHLQQTAYPDRKTVEDALPASWAITAEYPNSNLLVSAAVIWAEMLPPTAAVTRMLERRARRRGLPRLVNTRPVTRVVYLVEPRSAA